MKSKRRHELQTNVLADWLGDMLERIRPFQNAILGTVILLAIAIIGIMWWHNRSIAQAGEAWAAVPLGADAPQPYEQVEMRFPKTPAGEWSGILAADQYLFIGSYQLFHNKAAAAEALNKALEVYQNILKEATSPMAQERACFGLARTLECMNRLDEAVVRYQQVVGNWPKGMFATAAQDRLDDLAKMSTKEFYDRFARFNPKPPAPKESESGPAGKIGPLPENPPEPPSKPQPPAKVEIPKVPEPPAKADEPAVPEPPNKPEPPAK
ncbi:MAG: hypothetical protein ABR915_01595 [Thermoguttaceae bacterium]|jgi:tetratricopeptide (TPR) repeat protein